MIIPAAEGFWLHYAFGDLDDEHRTGLRFIKVPVIAWFISDTPLNGPRPIAPDVDLKNRYDVALELPDGHVIGDKGEWIEGVGQWQDGSLRDFLAPD